MTTSAATGYAPLLEDCFLFDAIEGAHDVTGIVGAVPGWLRGSYYVNGPARFTRGAMRYRHWLDGDGMVCALHFSGVGVEFVNRFVRTRKLEDEEEAGAPLYRTFGTAFPGDQLRYRLMLASPVNVSVYPFDGTLLAFGEQSLPVELDPRTLETRGVYDFHGRLNEVSPFAAHAKIDPATGRLVNFGMAYSPTAPSIVVYEFEPDGTLVQRRHHRISRPHSIHDCGITPEHAVFYLSPLLMDFERFIAGASVMESLRWTPSLGSQILIVPRAPGRGEAVSVRTGAGYCLHVINCFETDGVLTADILELDSPIYPEYEPVPDLFRTAPLGCPVRYRIELASRTLMDRTALPYDRTPDFPAIDVRLLGQPYATCWMLGMSHAGAAGRKFFDQVARVSWDSPEATDVYQCPAGEYLGGEPVFVHNPGNEAEAVVIVQLLNAPARQASIVLFDAFDLRRGPIARLPLGHRIHPGFHGSFAPCA